MFAQLIASQTASVRTNKPFSVGVSVGIHGIFILLLLAAPTVFPETIAGPQRLLTPPGPPLRAPRGTICLMTSAKTPTGTRIASAGPHVLTAPSFIPKKIDLKLLGEPGSSSSSGGEFPGQNLGPSFPVGSSTGIVGAPPQYQRHVLAPPQPAASVSQPERTIRHNVGGDVQQARLLHQVKPSYPQVARNVRVQGRVILEAVIDREGRVDKLRVLSGHPLLVAAALDAVRQWNYRPTLLNGEPVEVMTQVTVTFALDR